MSGVMVVQLRRPSMSGWALCPWGRNSKRHPVSTTAFIALVRICATNFDHGWSVQRAAHGSLCVFCKSMGSNRIGMSMPHPMLVLQQGNEFHVFCRECSANQLLPVGNRMTTLFLDRRKVRRRTFGLLFFHGYLSRSQCPSKSRFPKGTSRVRRTLWTVTAWK